VEKYVEIIRRNFGLKLLALGLAIVGWAYFRFATNPVLAARFDQQIAVPINAVNLPVGYVARFAEREATITVVERRGEAPIRPDNVKAVLDLSGKSAGVYNIPVQLVAPDVVVQSLSPASVTLTIEAIAAKTFRIAPHYGPQSSSVVVGRFSSSPGVVSVRGPASGLSQVAALRVDVAMPPAPAQFDEMVRPIPVDSSGNEIPDLQVAPDLVRVQVAFVAGSGSTAEGDRH
jgi:YbbR domain-containing protein